MAEWFYKATNKHLDHAGTMLLAGRGFLCRSAHTSKLTSVANVHDVRFGDIIHFFFVSKSVPHPLGAFEVIKREALSPVKSGPAVEDFGEVIPGTALYVVENPEFIKRLDDKTPSAYQPDPKLKKFTGWVIRKVGPAMKPDESFLQNQATLVAAKSG